MAINSYIENLNALTEAYVTGQQNQVADIQARRATKLQEQKSQFEAGLKQAEANIQSRIASSQSQAQTNYQLMMQRMQQQQAALPNVGGVPYTGSSSTAVNAAKGKGREAIAGWKPGQNLATVQTRAGKLTVHKDYAAAFAGFVNELGAKYGITSIGGYSNRNIAGSGTKSLHAYGLAIDINPGANPVTYGKTKTNLPPNIASLAAKYGLYWGGAWTGKKKDPMHFSALISG